MNGFFLILQRAGLFGLAALGVALLLQWLLSSRVPARWRVWIWRVALIQTALALVPFAPIALAVLPARAPVVAPKTIEAPTISASEPMPRIEAAPDVAAVPEAVLPPIGSEPSAMVEAPAMQGAPIAKPRYLIDINGWDDVAICIYLVGVALQIALLLRNIVRVRRSLSQCAPLDNAVLRHIAARLKIRRLPRLLQSASGSPFLVGIVRPTIVVPQNLNSAHLEAVFAHELAHHKRRDLTWNALLWALQTALWFHPLSWVSRRFHALEVESACDELTLQLTPIAPKSYGALLLGAESSQASPLTAGVNDHFFALQTRLKRLNCAPHQPRPATTWLVLGALLVSFVAVVPLRLVARAQNEAKVRETETKDFSGKVLDWNGKPVAGATIYALRPLQRDAIPMKQTVAGADGSFVLRGVKTSDFGVSVFADAGARGFIEKQVFDDWNRVSLTLARPVQLALTLTDERGRPLPRTRVQVGQVGQDQSFWMAIPRVVERRLRGTTDARGRLTLGPLPAGKVVWLRLPDANRFAPLGNDDSILLTPPITRATIQLRDTIRARGRVTLPDGRAAAGAVVSARRINAAEKVGDNRGAEGRFFNAKADAQGNYDLGGLRAGRYFIWADARPKAGDQTGAVVGFEKELDLKLPVNRVDFALPRGGLIQGVVLAKSSGKPVKGQTMGLRNRQGNYDYVITDVRGYFRFRSLAGAQHLWVHANGSNSPPPGFFLPAKSEFDFDLKDSEKREFKIEMPGKSRVKVTAPVTGVVLRPDGKPAADSTVMFRVMSNSWGEIKPSKTDKDGRFSLAPPYTKEEPLQLWADAGDLTTAQSVVATRGQNVTLRLASGVWASVSGQITDEKKQPVADAQININTLVGDNATNTRTARSDANGRYRFERVRPGLGVVISSEKEGYSHGYTLEPLIEAGQTQTQNIEVARASQTLSGTVYDENGKPAKAYQVWVPGQNSTVSTRADGKFYSPQVLAGPLDISVYSPMGKGPNSWDGFKATGGARDIVIRLSEKRRQGQRAGAIAVAAKKRDPLELIGENAPAIQATRWSNGRALSLSALHDQTVLLAFDTFYRTNNAELRDTARSFAGKFQIIGVQLNFEGAARRLEPVKSADEIARQMGFPIAVDAALPKREQIGWQTWQSYAQAPYVVIGRDGKIAYAGDKFDRALQMALAE